MSNFEKQTTAAGNAISPTAVAMTKCPPLFDRDTQAHVRVGFAEASETGDIPEIIGNDRGLYEGDLSRLSTLSGHSAFAVGTALPAPKETLPARSGNGSERSGSVKSIERC